MSEYDKEFYLKIAMINIDNALSAMEDIPEDREVRNELKQMKNRLESMREASDKTEKAKSNTKTHRNKSLYGKSIKYHLPYML